jgi:peptidoglycan/LPS O-acetylase OafA/YrhL
MLSKSYPYLLQALAVAAAFVVLSTFAFGHSTANAIDFAISIAVTALGLGVSAAGRGRVERGIGLAVTTLGAWSVLVTVGIFSGGTQRWVTFAAAAAVTALALAGSAIEESGVARRMPRLRTAPKAA